MTPRDRRLLADRMQLEELQARGALTFRAEGEAPERYEVMFRVPGLAKGPDGGLVVRQLHRCDVYLHREYPRRPPVVTWLTPVFHPNLLSPERNGGVCLGAWSAAESLADLCLRLRELVSWRSLNVADALDREAGTWASEHGVVAGTLVDQLLGLDLGEQTVVSLRHGGPSDG